MKLCVYRDTQLQVTENLWFEKFKSQHISALQDWKHILLLTTDYTGDNKNTEFIL